MAEMIAKISPFNTPSEYYSQYGVEAIDLAPYYGFYIGNVIKYLMRAGFKSRDSLGDLIKASDYLYRRQKRITEENLDPEFDLPKIDEKTEIYLEDKYSAVAASMFETNEKLAEIFNWVVVFKFERAKEELDNYIFKIILAEYVK